MKPVIARILSRFPRFGIGSKRKCHQNKETFLCYNIVYVQKAYNNHRKRDVL